MHAERLFIIKGKSPYYMKVMREKKKSDRKMDKGHVKMVHKR